MNDSRVHLLSPRPVIRKMLAVRGAFDAASLAMNLSGARTLIVPLTCCGYYLA